jgi:O-acetyl-ADP-ribose deacetylase (regulator of RNase III)
MATTIEVVLGDITEQDADAIVTAANESLLGGGGVDGAIHRAAGPRLAQAGGAAGPCDPGDAMATPAFDLDPPVRHVIHTVGPVWSGGGHGEDAVLASCYRRSLQVADSLGARTVAFPAVATGIYGFPAGRAARIAVETIRSTPTAVRHVRLMAFDERSLGILRAAVRARPPAPDGPVLPERSADDSDVGWGGYPEADHDERLREDRPPHWDRP